MNIFDIVGPVMVGPSSSHTAGAVRIGYIGRQLMGEAVKTAKILLHGSFWLTGAGHGTDKALLAGLLGMKTDDIRIANSIKIANEFGLSYEFDKIELRDVHPNTVVLQLAGKSGRELEIMASSLGGGRIKICKIDGLNTNFTGEYPTLVVHNVDEPGHVMVVTTILGKESVNIATMQLYRTERGGGAVMVIECDKKIPKDAVKNLEHLQGINKVTYLNLEDRDEF